MFLAEWAGADKVIDETIDDPMWQVINIRIKACSNAGLFYYAKLIMIKRV